MLKKVLITIVIVLILAFAWWTLSPLFYDRVVDEPFSDLVNIQPEQIQLSENIGVETPKAEEQTKEVSEPAASAEAPDLEAEVNLAPEAKVEPQPESALAPLEEVSRGQFEGADGHTASGTVILFRRGETYYLRFEDDFDSANAPDVFVHFGRDGAYTPEALVADLKGNRGAQNYEVPAGINVADYNEVWTWCRAFAVGIARAELSE